ncbi:MAG: threonine synthase [bacterium]|nr:MAG: threonine synthase [bacterium]
MHYFEGYRCGLCKREVPAGSSAGECPACSGPLLGVYDLGLLRRHLDRHDFFGPGEGVWRFASLLPATTCRTTLGEGNTPLLRAGRLGKGIELTNLFIKDESMNPTGSFKARGMAVAVSRLHDLGISEAAIPSAGNAGLALAAYGAAAGIDRTVFIPSETPYGVAQECRAYGADVEIVEGILPDAARKMEEIIEGTNIVRLTTFREPCRVEGKKTMAFEIEAEARGVHPDWIVFPTGGGTGVVAIWKAYRELEELGWLEHAKPHIAVVQASGCAPIVRAFERGERTAAPWEDPHTCACGIRVPSTRADRLILDVLYESDGAAVAVGDDEIITACREIASTEGVFPSPEGAASWAGVKALLHSGTIARSARIVIFNTAGGSRYPFLLEPFTR